MTFKHVSHPTSSIYIFRGRAYGISLERIWHGSSFWLLNLHWRRNDWPAIWSRTPIATTGAHGLLPFTRFTAALRDARAAP